VLLGGISSLASSAMKDAAKHTSQSKAPTADRKRLYSLFLPIK
jgi:hypothetical protein